ncbi:hypothetical protein ABI_13300 [Asticcacaulis biprosthecium C19]|uniref:Uncharacterized protein n=1 Tax=Asticcacaulis biprosthecium C19 TaxID=715226 RepID=F4QI26_9CAUL|nr:hypothetical protein ABI_13300 [Asticcacaulis biprosthecium C19]
MHGIPPTIVAYVYAGRRPSSIRFDRRCGNVIIVGPEGRAKNFRCYAKF